MQNRTRIISLLGVTFGICLSQFGVQTSFAQNPVPFDAVPVDASAPAGGFSVAPTRLVLDDKTRTESVALFNTAKETATFRIDAVDLIPIEKGGYISPEAGDAVPAWSAKPLVRFAPRQVTLKPGEKQSIKVISRARRDTEPAEYRTHLRFSSIPVVEDVKEPNEETQAQNSQSNGSVAISLGLEYRVSIPLLLRVGALRESLGIESVSINSKPGEDFVVAHVRLKRFGDESGFVRVEVLNQAGERMGLLKGVSIYPPLSVRELNIPLNQATGIPHKVVMRTNPARGEGEILSTQMFK